MSESGPAEYSAAGQPVRCTHCAARVFERREAQLNTAGMTFLNLDWLNREATLLICVQCGLIQWFAKKPERH